MAETGRISNSESDETSSLHSDDDVGFPNIGEHSLDPGDPATHDATSGDELCDHLMEDHHSDHGDSPDGGLTDVTENSEGASSDPAPTKSQNPSSQVNILGFFSRYFFQIIKM